MVFHRITKPVLCMVLERRSYSVEINYTKLVTMPVTLSVNILHTHVQVKSYARVHGKTDENDKGYVSVSYNWRSYPRISKRIS